MTTNEQRAELRDAIARSRLEAQEEHRRLAREAQALRALERAQKRALEPPKRRKHKQPLPPKSDPPIVPTPAEAELAERLLHHIAPESVIDRRRHATCIARTILRSRR